MSATLTAVVLLACLFVAAFVSLLSKIDYLRQEIKSARSINETDFRVLADRIRSVEELTKSARDTARTNRYLADEKLYLLAEAFGYVYDAGHSKPSFVKKDPA